ncbi:FHA domain-containing protein [Aestuariibius sp. 2305UL40-4]|uniref:FHA domain-containing protein n=1 Tax=Aestuariibius violaceus TaxID=3234132 RepID=UPI00345E4543
MACEVHVKSGCHSGAQSPIPEGETVFGLDQDCDVILADDGVADRHMTIQRKRKRMTVTALEAGVDVVGKGTIPAGHRVSLKAPADLRLGDVELHLTAPEPRAKLPSFTAAALALASVPCAVAALTLMPETGDGPGAADGTPIAQILRGDAPAAAGPVRPALTDDPLTAETALREKVSGSGLDRIDVNHDGEVLMARGTLPDAQMADWQAIERWFDGAFGDVALISDIRSAPVEELAGPPSIQSAWHSGRPFITVDDARYHEGSTLPNGWTLTSIGIEAANFEHDGQRIEIRY